FVSLGVLKSEGRTIASDDAPGSAGARIRKVRERLGRLELVELREIERHDGALVAKDVGMSRAPDDVAIGVRLARVDRLHPGVVHAAHADLNLGGLLRQRLRRLPPEWARL